MSSRLPIGGVCSTFRAAGPCGSTTPSSLDSLPAALACNSSTTTNGFDALRGSHSRRSSACGSANHAIAGGESVAQHVCE